MGKRSQRPARLQEKNVGCMWSLVHMFYFRRDAKFLLDRKQGSRRHTFSGFAGRGHSRKKSRDFEVDEDEDSIQECSTRKPTVKKLMEDELGKVKQVKKIPSDEVERILADLGNDVCLGKSSVQRNKQNGAKSHNTSTDVASLPSLLDPSGSKSMEQAEEDDLELSLADFLGQIYRYHDEWSHHDCKNKNGLCPELKSLIHMKLNELKSAPCIAYEETQEGVQKEPFYEKHLCKSRLYQSNKLVDTPEMLSPEKELLLKTLQKPDPHYTLEKNTQKNKHRHVETKLEPRKILEKVEDTKNSKQHGMAVKTQSKESRHIFFWRKDKSIRGTSEGTSSNKTVNKIVILKPYPRRGFDTTIATAPSCLWQQTCTIQSPEYSATENSKFSIKQVRRRFRIVAGETNKERPSVYEDDFQRDPCWIQDPVFTIRKGSKQAHEQTLTRRASGAHKDDLRPSTSGKEKQSSDGLGEINRDIITSKDTSIFYKEAKKHLTEILKCKSQTTEHPTVQTSKSLEGMLTLHQCDASSPWSSPRAKDCMDLSPEETNISGIHKVGRKESAKEINRYDDDSGNLACGSEVLDHKAQEGHSMKQETARDGDAVNIEETAKPYCSETICSGETTPTEQCRCNSQLEIIRRVEPVKEHAEMFLSYPENAVESLEYQEPKTPRPIASLELMSQISLEGNNEKQEQPSPVSVLDPFFHEDADSPEPMIQCELHQDMTSFPTRDATSDQQVFWEDKDARLGYIKEVLELSELCRYQNIEVWYLEDELISPCLVEELHQGNPTDDLKLFFDCICEAITVIQETYFRNPPCLSFVRHKIQPPPMGQNLIPEINKHIERHLHNQFPSTLHQLVSMDLEDDTWLNLRSESEEIAVDVWEFILDELLEEVASDLWI